MSKSVIFDFNGVFIKSRNLSDRFHEDFGVPTEEFLPALKEIMNKVREPNAGPAFPLWESYLRKWGVNFNEEQFYDYWFGGEYQDDELFKFARELKERGFKVFILSNNFVERSKYYMSKFPDLLALFNKVYFSWQTGFKKPDLRVWQLVIEENGLKPDECFYFDDSETNIEVAKSLGLNAFIYEGLEKTREILEGDATIELSKEKELK